MLYSWNIHLILWSPLKMICTKYNIFRQNTLEKNCKLIMLFSKNSPSSCHSIKIPAQPCLSILLTQKKLPTYLTPGAFLQPIWAYFSGKHASNCRKWNALPPKLQVFFHTEKGNYVSPSTLLYLHRVEKGYRFAFP